MITLTNDTIQDANYDRDSAQRVGHRIKTIRTNKGMSRAQLAEKVDLPPNRIEGYERGARKPKLDLLQKIAAALEVSPFALMDQDNESYIGAMYSLFEISSNFEMDVDEIDGKPVIIIKDTGLQTLISEWSKVKRTVLEEEKNGDYEHIIYKAWTWNFENCFSKTWELEEERKRQKISEKKIKDKIKKETQAEIDELNNRIAELKKKLSEI